jgi:MFS family permease
MNIIRLHFFRLLYSSSHALPTFLTTVCSKTRRLLNNCTVDKPVKAMPRQNLVVEIQAIVPEEPKGFLDDPDVDAAAPAMDAGAPQHYSLPQQNRTTDSPVVLHTTMFASTASLCLCMLTHSFLLISVFPYSGFMAVELIESVDEETAGAYAGLLASCFMWGRATTAYGWGQVADVYGRTTVLYWSFALSGILSIAFGLSPTFGSALFLRFALGCANGIMGSIKTIVSEISAGNEALETKTMTMVIGMWGWGFLVSPALSGILAEPVKQYPGVEWLQREGIWNAVLAKHPFLLPNLLAAIFCLIGVLVIRMFVPETLPFGQRRDPRLLLYDIGAWCQRSAGYAKVPLNVTRYQLVPTLKTHPSDLDLSSRNTRFSVSCHNAIDEDDLDAVQTLESNEQVVSLSTNIPEKATILSLLSRKPTRTCLLIYWAYSFVGLTVDESFPLFCISKQAGFGLSEYQIGQILSLCGLFFAVSQYSVYTTIYNRFGLYGSIRFGSCFSAPVMFLMPLSVLLNRGAPTGHLRTSALVFLSTCMAAYRVFGLVFFSSVSVTMNRTVPRSHRATMNGLSVLGGSVAKGLGPIFAGFLVSGSVALWGSLGGLLIFGTIGLIGCAVAATTFFYLQASDCEGSTDDLEQSVVGDTDQVSPEGVELTKPLNRGSDL